MIPFSNELEYYKEYQKKLKAYVGEQKAKNIISDSLYLLSLGTNDFLENYFLLRRRRSQYTVDKYQDFLAGIAERFIKDLYGLGARKISLGGLPPMGCLPLERSMNLIAGRGDTCIESYNMVALSFNAKLNGLVNKLNKELSGVKVVFSNPYFILRKIIQRPSSYGQ